MRPTDLPSGTVTFLFTDVEGSTRLLHELGAEAYASALQEHRRVLREAFALHGGVEIDTQGDAFFVAFPTAPEALAAAASLTEALATGPIRVRVGTHTGTPLVTEEGYVGPDVHRAARIAAVAHGGQVVVSSATAALIDPETLQDLGEHRLKDLSAPERIYQLGEQQFPPLSSLYQTNLPVPSTPFLGREKELGEVAALLSRDDVRLLTLTGPGGTGKTRLALQAAAELVEHYSDGVFWVGLAPLHDPALVSSTIAHSLAAKGELAAHIGSKRMLLLLDNLEQLVAAAPEIGSLLAACPRLNLLVTSREPLHLVGEREYAVAPLAEQDAVALFTERALAVRSDFAGNGEVVEICRRLDHLPLAVELAAARAKALSPKLILARLEQRLPLLTGGARDLPERQRTLRGAIAWSFELLSPSEQDLFARVSVFAGCTLEAVEAVCDADLDTLASLVDKSLLREADDRFWMLETIREFAADQLATLGQLEAMRRRHAAYFLALAEEMFDEWGDASDPQGYARFGEEQDNFREATACLIQAGGEDALRLLQRLWASWFARGQLDEGERWVRLALEAGADAPAPLRAWMLGVLGEFPRFRGEHDRAIKIKEEAIAMSRTLGMDHETKAFLCDMAESLAYLGEHERARRLLAEALEIEEEERPRKPGATRARAAAAELAMMARRYEEARRWYADLLETIAPRRQEMTSSYIWVLGSFGECLRRLGDRDGAAERFREALTLAIESRMLTWVPDVLDGLAGLAAARSPYRAAVLFGAGEAVRAETGLAIYDPAEHAAIEQCLHRNLDVADVDSALAEGRGKSIEEAVQYAIETLNDP
jgi:predicted ATPase